jgi:uncharacterized protein YndB with AHSA1/START domain
MTNDNTQDKISDAIVVECDLDAAPEKVWRALTVPEILAAWLMPNDIDPTVGRRFTFEAGAGQSAVECEVLAAEPNRLLRYRWCGGEAERDAAGRRLDSILTFELAETETGGTHLRLVHDSFSASPHQSVTSLEPGWAPEAANSNSRTRMLLAA